MSISNKTWERALSAKGQTVVPKKIREYLDINGGDALQWTIGEQGEVVVTPKKKVSVMDSYGMLKPKNSVKDVDQAISEAKEKMAHRKHQDGSV